MKTISESALGGITLSPCQLCNQLKEKFYLCNRNHTTCDDCKELRNKDALRPPVADTRASPSGKHVRFSLPLTPESLSSSTGKLSSGEEEDEDHRKISPEPTELEFDDGPSVRSPRKSSGRRSPPPRIVTGDDDSENLEIFCRACDDFVEATPLTLPMPVLKSLVTQSFDPVDAESYPADEDEEEFDSADTLVPMTSVEPSSDDDLRKDVDNLRVGLANAYSELLTTRCELDEVMYTTEKLEMDVDMLRGGVNYVYFNFETVQKRKEVRLEERICGIPFVLMVRLRMVSRVPHLGFFIGLEPYEGRAHSPLKKIIVFRAHNAYGKVIEKHTLETFENGQIAHPCFDLTKPHDGSLWGYANFLRKDRILKPDMLKDGRLCLSLQIKPLM